MIAAYLISVLTRRLLLKPADFRARYPNAWLVWEPGSWEEPKTQEMAAGDTVQPGQERPVTPVGEDALCFELKPRDAPLKIGRAPDNHIILNDMRVSRSQLELRHDGQSWQLFPVPGARNLVFGQPVEEVGLTLTPNTKIHAGGILLSFYEAEDFAARLDTEAQKFKR